MNPGYLRIRVPRDETLRRFAASRGLAEVGPLVSTTATEAVRLACDDRDRWRGQAVFVAERAGWTVLSDLTGGLGAVTSAAWLAFAVADDVVFAAYNDAIAYGALVVITGGVVLADILFDGSSPGSNHLVDRRPGARPITDWLGVAGFVDSDELGCEADDGWLWVYEPIA